MTCNDKKNNNIDYKADFSDVPRLNYLEQN